MIEEDKVINDSSSETSASLVVNTQDLNRESLEIINQVIAEQDIAKTKDLTELFNQNQKKKTMVRVNKLNDLLDKITDQAIERFSRKPDEISNQELLQGLKVVQDSLERGQNQLNNTLNTPLIQVNQQTNEINVGSVDILTKDSRDKVKNVVANILAGIANKNSQQSPQDEIIDAEVEEVKEVKEETKND